MRKVTGLLAQAPSRLTNFFPKKIHAVTPRGFELKNRLLPAGLLHPVLVGGNSGLVGLLYRLQVRNPAKTSRRSGV
jgi:hypothetical protein